MITPEQQEAIENAIDHSALLTEWEVNFIDSLSNLDGDRVTLSPKQLAVLDRIGKKITDEIVK